jgi:hypothetical protein
MTKPIQAIEPDAAAKMQTIDWINDYRVMVDQLN